MVDLGPVRRFLGMGVEATKEGYSINQETYIESMLRRFGIEDAYNVATPVDINVSLDISKNT